MSCLFCDGILDRYDDHARVCSYGGDHTTRYHRLRSIVVARAHATAGLHSKIEKDGLLLPRSDHRGGPEAETVLAQLVLAVALKTFGSAVGGLHGITIFDFAYFCSNYRGPTKHLELSCIETSDCIGLRRFGLKHCLTWI